MTVYNYSSIIDAKDKFEERHSGYVGGGIFPRVIPSEDISL